MTTADIIREALTQYAQRAKGRDSQVAAKLARAASELATAYDLVVCDGWTASDFSTAIRASTILTLSAAVKRERKQQQPAPEAPF